jgi:hypothetical protein
MSEPRLKAQRMALETVLAISKAVRSDHVTGESYTDSRKADLTERVRGKLPSAQRHGLFTVSRLVNRAAGVATR